MSARAIQRFFSVLHRPILAGSLFLLATAGLAQQVSDDGLLVQPGYLNLTGLSQPTGLRFSGPGEGFVIEKATGQVRHFDASGLTTALDLNVQFDSERGLLGLALDPQFQSNGYVYLYYSATASSTDSQSPSNWAGNRLARYQWNGSALTDTGASRTWGVPTGGQAEGPNHDGGPLTFGPDGKLYGVTGDLNRNRAEQNNQANAAATSGVGGIYRLNSDLSIPSGSAANPFSGSFEQWYAYGVRNSFGLAFDPVTGRLWDTENGPSSYDEINLVPRGFNSGWNQIMGPDSRSPQNAPDDLVVLPGSTYSDPEFSFENPVAVTSLAFLAGSSWGSAYDNGLVVGDNNTGRLYLLRLNQARDGFVLTGVLGDQVADGDAEASLLAFGSGFGVVTDLQIGPDQALYVLSLSKGQVFRIAPVPEPATWAMLLAALFPVIWVAHRRRNFVRG